MQNETIYIQFITGILVVLVVLFVSLIIYSLARRRIRKYQEKKFTGAEEYMMPIIYGFMDKEIDTEEFSARIRSRYDLKMAYKNVNVIIDNVKGVERERLKTLLNIEEYHRYFLRQLYSSKIIEIARACVYFEKKVEANQKVMNKLRRLQHHSYPVICYAATLALINTNDSWVQNTALTVFIAKNNNSTMSIHDIVFKYYNNSQDEEKTAQFLFSIVSNSSTPVKSSAAIVKMFPELGFYQLIDPLYTLLIKLHRKRIGGRLMAAIIEVLCELYHPELDKQIEDTFFWASYDEPVRFAVVKWMNEHYRKEFDDALFILAVDPSHKIRIVAQTALLKLNASRKVTERLPADILGEWHEIERSGGAHVAAL